MRALPALLRARQDIKVVLVGGDGVSYGSGPRRGANWREVMLAEVGKDIDRDRIVFPGRIPYATYLSMLQRSDAHVYLTYPFVASWSLRESLALGCPVIGSDTQPVQEFLTHGENGLLVPFLEPQTLAQTVLDLLEDKALNRTLRANAREYGKKHLGMKDYLAAYNRLIERLTGENPAAPAVLARSRKPAAAAGTAKAAMPRRKRLVTAA
jgi:glycosyltransferase involved in cell wall biosynthesis